MAKGAVSRALRVSCCGTALRGDRGAGAGRAVVPLGARALHAEVLTTDTEAEAVARCGEAAEGDVLVEAGIDRGHRGKCHAGVAAVVRVVRLCGRDRGAEVR